MVYCKFWVLNYNCNAVVVNVCRRIELLLELCVLLVRSIFVLKSLDTRNDTAVEQLHENKLTGLVWESGLSADGVGRLQRPSSGSVFWGRNTLLGLAAKYAATKYAATLGPLCVRWWARACCRLMG